MSSANTPHSKSFPSLLPTDEVYMRRCLQLARCGRQNAKPNPMVGAVIVSHDSRIIGEGYHVKCGQAHAEVNAFASVSPEDQHLLPEATIYVSLEPCSHWGKTPPCADLIVRKGVRRVVCGCIDPFAEVQGRGVERMRKAGIEVTVGVLEQECRELNRRFFTVNTEKRPYIILKWAQTVNRKISNSLPTSTSTPQGDRLNASPLRLSTPFTAMLVHKLRAENDAILVGRRTLDNDHPRLNVRHWTGPTPAPLVLTHHADGVPQPFRSFGHIDTLLRHLYESKMQSLVVEGGTATLKAFIERGLWDEIRVETAPFAVDHGVDAPTPPSDARLVSSHIYDSNTIYRFIK